MTKEEIYICDICKAKYSNLGDAVKCERGHQKVDAARMGPLKDGIPEYIDVSLRYGKRCRYIFDKKLIDLWRSSELEEWNFLDTELYDINESPDIVKKVFEIIKSEYKKDGYVQQVTITKRLKNTQIKGKQINDAIEFLIEKGVIERINVSCGNRPSYKIYYTPEFYERFLNGEV